LSNLRQEQACFCFFLAQLGLLFQSNDMLQVAAWFKTFFCKLKNSKEITDGSEAIVVFGFISLY